MSSETERNQILSNSIQIYLKHQRNLLNSRRKQSAQPSVLYPEKRKPIISNLVGDWQLTSGNATQLITNKSKPNAVYNQSSDANDNYKSTIDTSTPKWIVNGYEIEPGLTPPIRSHHKSQREDPRVFMSRGKKHKSDMRSLELPGFCHGIDHFGEWKEAVTRKEEFPLIVVDKLRNSQYGRHSVSTNSLERLFSKCGDLEDVFHLDDIAIIRYKSMNSAKNAASTLKSDRIEGKLLSLRYDPTGYYTTAWLRHRGITHSEFDYKTMMRRNKPKKEEDKKEGYMIVLDTKTNQEYKVPYHYILNLHYLRKHNLQFCVNFLNHQCHRKSTCNYVHVKYNFWGDSKLRPEEFIPPKWIEITSGAHRMSKNDLMNIFSYFSPSFIIFENGIHFIKFVSAAKAHQSLELKNKYSLQYKLSTGPKSSQKPLHNNQSNRNPPPNSKQPPISTPLKKLPSLHIKPTINPSKMMSVTTPTPMTPVEQKMIKIEKETSQEEAIENAVTSIIDSLSKRCNSDLKKRVFIPQIQVYLTEKMNEKESNEKKLRFERMQAERRARELLALEEKKRREKAREEQLRLQREARERIEAAQRIKQLDSDSENEEKLVAPRKRKKSLAKRKYPYMSSSEIQRQHPHVPSESEKSLPIHNLIPVPITGCTRTEGYTAKDVVELKKSDTYRKALLRAQLEESLSERLVSEEIENDEVQNVAATRSNRLQKRNLRQQYSASIEGGSGMYDDAFEFSSRSKRLRFGRSAIHEYGLFACQNIKQGDFIIQYVGEVIRHAVADRREIGYEAIGIGSSYMFRLDDQYIIDATHMGNVARFINHSCDPNCQAQFLSSRNETKIIFRAAKDIFSGDEITFDYKFPYEEEKIPCSCGAPNCKQYLN